MKKMIALLIINFIISSNVFAYPLGFKATGLTTKYPALIDLGFLKASNSGSTTTVTSLGAASGDSLVLGGTINANAVADFQSTTKAFLFPRMTTTQKLAIPSPTTGMMVYDTTLLQDSFYNGTSWVTAGGLEQCPNAYDCTDTFSAQITTTTGAVSNQSVSWISSCTAANPTVCTFNTNLKDGTNPLLSAMNCTATVANNSASAVVITSNSTTSITLNSFTTTNGAAAASIPFTLRCQKGNLDYKPKTSKVAASIGVATVANATGGIKLFGAEITTTSGTITSGKNFGGVITSCTAANPTVCTLTGLTAAPHCVTSMGNDTFLNAVSRVTAETSSSVTIDTRSGANGALTGNLVFKLTCFGAF